jgi:hypothetical protein
MSKSKGRSSSKPRVGTARAGTKSRSKAKRATPVHSAGSTAPTPRPALTCASCAERARSRQAAGARLSKPARAFMTAFGESCRRLGHHLPAVYDPSPPPPVHRSIVFASRMILLSSSYCLRRQGDEIGAGPGGNASIQFSVLHDHDGCPLPSKLNFSDSDVSPSLARRAVPMFRELIRKSNPDRNRQVKGRKLRKYHQTLPTGPRGARD